MSIERWPSHLKSRALDSFFSFQNKPKNLDPSYKMDLDFWDCSGRVKLVLQNCDLVICSHSREGKSLSYSRINMILEILRICQIAGILANTSLNFLACLIEVQEELLH